MDDVLVDVFYDQHMLGRRSSETFTTQAIDCIVTALRNVFPNTTIDKEHIHNRIKNLKRQCFKWYDVFKHGLSDL